MKQTINVDILENPDGNVERVRLVEDALNYSVKRHFKLDATMPSGVQEREVERGRAQVLNQLANHVIEVSKSTVEVCPSPFDNTYVIEARVSLTALESKQVSRLEQEVARLNDKLDLAWHEIIFHKSKYYWLSNLPWYKYLWLKLRGKITQRG